MTLKHEFRNMIVNLTERFTIPPITNIFLPPFCENRQPRNADFAAICLAGGAAGISYFILPRKKRVPFKALRPSNFIGRNPREFALEFGSDNPAKETISLAAINAICQHVIKASGFVVDTATDSIGLLSVSAGDRVGMVGLFNPLIKTIREKGAELTIVEKNELLIDKYPDLPITLDITKLKNCNKVLCTSTTILNNSLDEILRHCLPDAFVSVIGPSAGYFPDPLFARGVDVVGGRMVKDGELFIKLLTERKRWGEATQKICFRKDTYTSII